MAARAVELLPVPYFHVVFTLPSAIGDIAYHNNGVYDLLLRVSAETMLTIAADPRHLGARIAILGAAHLGARRCSRSRTTGSMDPAATRR